MSMCGHYLRISPEELNDLQSQPEVFKEFLYLVMSPECLQACKEQYCFLNRFFYDLHFYLGRLLALDSLWREWGVSSTGGEIGKKIENVSFGMGTVRFVAPNEV